MARLRLQSEEDGLRIERLELEQMKRDVEARRAEQECWEEEQKERMRMEDDEDLRQQILAAQQRQWKHNQEYQV